MCLEKIHPHSASSSLSASCLCPQLPIPAAMAAASCQAYPTMMDIYLYGTIGQNKLLLYKPFWVLVIYHNIRKVANTPHNLHVSIVPMDIAYQAHYWQGLQRGKRFMAFVSQ